MPWPFRRRRPLTLPPLTFGLWREVRRAVGAPPKGGAPVPAWDPAAAPLADVLAVLDTVGAGGEWSERAAREAAAVVWAVLAADAAAQLSRAAETVERIETALGNYLDDGPPTSPERGLYALDAADLDVLLGWPLWQAVEYLGVRAVEHDYQEENRRLASTN